MDSKRDNTKHVKETLIDQGLLWDAVRSEYKHDPNVHPQLPRY